MNFDDDARRERLGPASLVNNGRGWILHEMAATGRLFGATRPRIATDERVKMAEVAPQPRPMNGIFVAANVMNWTLASSGSVAM